MRNTGFEGDGFHGEKILELCMGEVVERKDPDGRGRIRARIPGKMELTDWAAVKGGGSNDRGKVDVPPLGADVYIQFINGDPDRPVYEPADYGVKEDGAEMFQEHTDPDISVFGIGPFRLVIDNREAEGGEEAIVKTARFKLVKDVGGVEEDIAWVEISEENSIHIFATSAVGIESGAIIDIDAPVVQIKKRKIIANARPIA